MSLLYNTEHWQGTKAHAVPSPLRLTPQKENAGVENRRQRVLVASYDIREGSRINDNSNICRKSLMNTPSAAGAIGHAHSD